jgi:putative endonuclease
LVLKIYYVYIMASLSQTLYIGVTNHLVRRVQEHKEKSASVFTAKYNVNCLVYFEEFADIVAAIARETQLKGWSRARKIGLIESSSPNWKDLSEDW